LNLEIENGFCMRKIVRIGRYQFFADVSDQSKGRLHIHVRLASASTGPIWKCWLEPYVLSFSSGNKSRFSKRELSEIEKVISGNRDLLINLLNRLYACY
jgi:hypothetical protein